MIMRFPPFWKPLGDTGYWGFFVFLTSATPKSHPQHPTKHRKMMRPRTWMIWSLQKEPPPFTVGWPGWTVVWPCGAVCLSPYPPCSGEPWSPWFYFGGRTVRSFESRIRFNRFAENPPSLILETFQNMRLSCWTKLKQVLKYLPEFPMDSHHFARDLECPKTEMYSFEPGAKLQNATVTSGTDLKGPVISSTKQKINWIEWSWKTPCIKRETFFSHKMGHPAFQCWQVGFFWKLKPVTLGHLSRRALGVGKHLRTDLERSPRRVVWGDGGEVLVS